jgi:hypothetical protein
VRKHAKGIHTLACPTASLNFCSLWRRPPTRKLAPSTCAGDRLARSLDEPRRKLHTRWSTNRASCYTQVLLGPRGAAESSAWDYAQMSVGFLTSKRLERTDPNSESWTTRVSLLVILHACHTGQPSATAEAPAKGHPSGCLSHPPTSTVFR